MSKAELPPCSVRDCKQAAGAIINGALLCAEHALEEFRELRLLPTDNEGKNRPISRNRG